MQLEKREVKLVLTSKMLGTVPKNKEVYTKYIATKTPDEDKRADEIDSVTDIEEKGWTGFHTDDDGLFIYDYMLKGFFKSACEALVANGSPKLPAYKKWIDKLIFINPRHIYFGGHNGDDTIIKPDGCLERPLRTMTPKGERVTVTRSDYVKEGTTLTFIITILTNNKGIDFEKIMEWFEYGQFVGLGQWRGSGGYGRFTIIK